MPEQQEQSNSTRRNLHTTIAIGSSLGTLGMAFGAGYECAQENSILSATSAVGAVMLSPAAAINIYHAVRETQQG